MPVHAINQVRPKPAPEALAPRRTEPPADTTAHKGKSLLVVLPFCNADLELCIKNLTWIRSLEGNDLDNALLTYEVGTDPDARRIIRRLADETFGHVEELEYAQLVGPRPWPRGSNHAFAETAKHIAMDFKEPFLWLETDSAPIRPDWLERIQEEYNLSGKPFMGAVVEELGCMNGQGVYPPNVRDYSLRAFNTREFTPDSAWDFAMRDETEDWTYAANHVFCHVWLLNEGRPSVFHGAVPTFPDHRLLDRLISHHTCIVHRCKDGSLIDRLQERRAR